MAENTGTRRRADRRRGAARPPQPATPAPVDPRVAEAERFGQTARQYLPPGPMNLLDRAAGVASGVGNQLYGLAADVSGAGASVVGFPELAAALERQSDIAYNVAQDQYQRGYTSGASRSAADYDMEPADFRAARSASPAAPTTSLRPQARPEQITADQVRQLFGSSPLEMGRPVDNRQAEPTISGAALRLLGTNLQQMISGAQSQELERMRQATPASPLTGRDLIADNTARAAQRIFENEMADLSAQYPDGVPLKEENAAIRRYVNTLSNDLDPGVLAAMMARTQE